MSLYAFRNFPLGQIDSSFLPHVVSLSIPGAEMWRKMMMNIQSRFLGFVMEIERMTVGKTEKRTDSEGGLLSNWPWPLGRSNSSDEGCSIKWVRKGRTPNRFTLTPIDCIFSFWFRFSWGTAEIPYYGIALCSHWRTTTTKMNKKEERRKTSFGGKYEVVVVVVGRT